MDVRIRCIVTTYIIIGLSQLIRAQGQDIPVVSVRLMEGSSAGSPEVRDGRVEVLYEGQWGTICDDGWGSVESGVICRMLGYIGASRAHNGSFFPPAANNVRLLLDDVKCDGNEASIAECRHAAWGVSNCGHSEDAGVTCLGQRIETTPAPTPRTTTTRAPPTICDNPRSDIRLVDGENVWVGRVQVRAEGRWWEVCDDSWGLQDAQVVCKMLCYNPTNARAHLGPAFGNMTESILLDDVDCAGNEDTLLDCVASPQKVHNCDYTEGAGVSCIPDDEGPPLVPEPEVECQSETETITAIFLRSDDVRLRPEHLTVEGVPEDCGFTTRMEESYVYIVIPFIGCNTQRSINETHIIYNNVVHHEVPPEDDIITRRQIFLIPVICLMGRNDDPDNVVSPEKQTAPPQYGLGHFEVDMYIFRSSRFNEIIDTFPARVILRQFVYVGLTLTTTDRRLKIVVPSCYVTPEEDPTSTPQRVLVEDKCAVDDSITYYPINQTMFAFRFKSFVFQTDSELIYLHCKVYVCGTEEKHRRCDRTCSYGSSDARRKKRDVSESFDVFFSNHTIYNRERGPLVVYDPFPTQSALEGTTTMMKTTTKQRTSTVKQSTIISGNYTTPPSDNTPTGSTTTKTILKMDDDDEEEPVVIPAQIKAPAASSTDHVGIAIGTLLVMCMTALLHL